MIHTEVDDLSAHDQQLGEVISGYLKAVEGGQTPSRQELLRGHAALAPELTEFFTDRDRLERMAAPLRAAVQAATLPGRAGSRVGDYEIVEEIGRGGMGAVFAARQERPRRMVALKMILAGARAGRQRLERFRDESEILARLRHPNIVRVYEVGEHDGWPFFTMDHAEGGSLAEKLAIAALPPRTAAELLRTLARAVHSAHEQGVVHRDLKPSNVLLTADGVPLIGDFGLAKQLGDVPGPPSAGRATETGAIVGTPGYMAPEQAGGGGKDCEPAVDVYALGAILYECLTGRPPFKAATVLETLEQVRTREPVPPGRLQPGLPRDLQTICLKCLEKEPRRRYESACALGDDLGRFLAGEPIRARPTPPWRRVGMWVRRRPSLAASLLVSAAALVALVGGGVVHTVQLRQAADAAEQSAAEARRQRGVAAARYHAARDTLTRMLARLEAQPLADVPRLKELREQQLEDTLAFYQDVLNGQDDPDPALREDTAIAYEQAASIQMLLGRLKPARENFRRAADLIEQLPDELRETSDEQARLVHCYNHLASLAHDSGRKDEAERYYRSSLAIDERMVRRLPDDEHWQSHLAAGHLNLGANYLIERRSAEAEACFEEAIKVLAALVHDRPTVAYRCQLAGVYQNLAMILAATDRRERAGQTFDEAEKLLAPAVHDEPDNSDFAYALASVYLNRGNLRNATGRPLDALADHTRAVDLIEPVLRKEPRLSLAIHYALNAHGARAQDYDNLKRYAEAAADWDAVVAHAEGPSRARFRVARAVTLVRSGAYVRAASEASALADDSTLDPEAVCNLACVLALAVGSARQDAALSLTERAALAETYARQAVALLARLKTQGYFRKLDHAGLLVSDRDLDALRDRPDFRELLKSDSHS